jgi:hypothetical protein
MSTLSIAKNPPIIIPLTTYSATVGTDLIEVGNLLQAFVEEIRSCWPTGIGEDVAIWSGKPGRQRLVAIIRNNCHGVPTVTWL